MNRNSLLFWETAFFCFAGHLFFIKTGFWLIALAFAIWSFIFFITSFGMFVLSLFYEAYQTGEEVRGDYLGVLFFSVKLKQKGEKYEKSEYDIKYLGAFL